MKEQVAKLLTDYAHQRGGMPVSLTDPAVALDLAEVLIRFVPEDEDDEDPSQERRKEETP